MRRFWTVDASIESKLTMDFYTYTTNQDACTKAGVFQDAETFYRLAFADAGAVQSAQFFYQLRNERDWEQARRPYYNVWPSIVPMLTRLTLDLDSSLVNLPMPALCIRLPKQQNPLTFEWKGETLPIRCMLLGDMDKNHQTPGLRPLVIGLRKPGSL